MDTVTKAYQNDQVDWDAGREGYVDTPRTPVYVSTSKAARKSGGKGHLLSITAEVRFGSLLAAAGTVWGTYVATQDYASLWTLQLSPPGPLEICALGVLIWLHAKWRRSTKVD